MKNYQNHQRQQKLLHPSATAEHRLPTSNRIQLETWTSKSPLPHNLSSFAFWHYIRYGGLVDIWSAKSNLIFLFVILHEHFVQWRAIGFVCCIPIWFASLIVLKGLRKGVVQIHFVSSYSMLVVQVWVWRTTFRRHTARLPSVYFLVVALAPLLRSYEVPTLRGRRNTYGVSQVT